MKFEPPNYGNTSLQAWHQGANYSSVDLSNPKHSLPAYLLKVSMPGIKKQDALNAALDSDLVDLELLPIPRNAIHMISVDAKSPTLKARDLCALESAALHNPNTPVMMSIDYDKLDADRMVKHLLARYDNIIFRKFDIKEIVNDTVLDGWYQLSGIGQSKFKVPYESDMARVALLHKYGGWYMDLDVILIKSLEDIPYKNVLSLKYIPSDEASVSNGFMRFEQKHPFLHEYMEGMVSR